MKILFATSEAFPLIKTGGLGDVSNSLPNALSAKACDVRLVLPAYPEVLESVRDLREVARFHLPVTGSCRILECRHASFRFPIMLVDDPDLFNRPGNPYVDETGVPWSDNAERFGSFSRAVALLGMGACTIPWQADIVHCNDWQTGLVPGLLSRHENRPRSVFTIHNVSYDCLFDYQAFARLQLPAQWWSIEGGEFYGRFSMQKCGIVYSDAITTVSPSYAREICTPEFGYGYSGILNAHRGKLSGIINGIDVDVWNPCRDVHLACHYGIDDEVPAAKRVNLSELLRVTGAVAGFCDNDSICLGFVGRLVYQKGIDVLLEAIPQVLARLSARFILLGTGESALELRLNQLATAFPDNVLALVGYSELHAHLLEAGCDLFLMPSRFEPCGLNQMYSMLYGTPPIVHRTGGLADTVTDACESSLMDGTATGFVFDQVSVEELVASIGRAIEALSDPVSRNRLIRNGMSKDFAWDASASNYLDLYRNCPQASVAFSGRQKLNQGTNHG